VATRLDPARRTLLRDALRPTTPSAAAKLDRILAGEGVVVTTGQQPALLGGPLYTLYKTLTAVRLAEALEARLEMPVLAVFWVASDDHDWEEAHATWLIDEANELRRFDLADDGPPVSMAKRRLPPAVSELVAAAIGALPGTGFAARYADATRNAFAPGRSMAEAFHELMRTMLGDFDLATLDSAHPSLKRAAVPVLRHELEHFAEHTAALQRQTARLVEEGFHAQVTISDDAANVLFEDEHGRERLVRVADGWELRRTRRVLSEAEVASLLESEPERFSANVLLRPVVESSVLPTVSYVAGPGEMAYFAQIGCLFRAHSVAPPVVHPRAGVTLVERKVAKVLEKFGLSPADVERPYHEVAAAVVQSEVPESAKSAARGLREDVERGYEALAAAAERVDPTLRGWLEGERNRSLARVRAAERKVARHVRKRRAVELEQLRKAAVNLYPEGTPQERLLNALPYMARYGPGLLASVAEAIEVRLDGRSDGWDGVHCTDGDAASSRLPAAARAG
jgi:bacillithiol biosynthesis cysteine-adding enzyme BshC